MTDLPLEDDEDVAPPRRLVSPPRRRLQRQATSVGRAVALGGQLALTNEAGDIMVDIAKEMAKDMPMVAIALEHPDGREVAKLFVALMLHTATVHTSLVPKSDFVGRAAELQMTASSMTLLQPRLKALRGHFLKLAEVGEQVAEFSSAQARVETDEELAEAEAEVERELAEMKAAGTGKSKPRSRAKA
jgi:hypothetical protein